MKRIAFFLAVTGLAFMREGAAQTVYTSQHDVLVQAIKTGHADGVLTGPAAELFTRQFRSQGALLVKANVVRSFPQPECKRVEMVYTKKDVIGQHGPQDVVMNTKLNYCLDGRPPSVLEDKP